MDEVFCYSAFFSSLRTTPSNVVDTARAALGRLRFAWSLKR